MMRCSSISATSSSHSFNKPGDKWSKPEDFLGLGDFNCFLTKMIDTHLYLKNSLVLNF